MLDKEFKNATLHKIPFQSCFVSTRCIIRLRMLENGEINKSFLFGNQKVR